MSAPPRLSKAAAAAAAAWVRSMSCDRRLDQSPPREARLHTGGCAATHTLWLKKTVLCYSGRDGSVSPLGEVGETTPGSVSASIFSCFC